MGTVTEIHDYLRILFSRLARCIAQNAKSRWAHRPLIKSPKDSSAHLKGLKPYRAPLEVQPGEASGNVARFARRVMLVVRPDGSTFPLDTVPALDLGKKQRVQVVVDRMVIRQSEQSRISDSVEQALSRLVSGSCKLPLQTTRSENEWQEASPRSTSFVNNAAGSFPGIDTSSFFLQYSHWMVSRLRRTRYTNRHQS